VVLMGELRRGLGRVVLMGELRELLEVMRCECAHHAALL
jgi:hypothetical protein